ncbi:MAG TPA: LPXTG cell wall anchor domain-containing protein [Phycisphaerales bacterium]|nr:LPXTG cell wall anchor domain-containing protein [Phycisphaerales bacterium]
MTTVYLAQEPAPAAPPPKRATTGDIMLAAGVLIGIALVGGFVWMYLRKRLFAPDSASSAGTIMEDLRRMRQEGKITQEEYDSIRKNMAARLARSGFGDEKPSQGTDRGPGRGPGARDGR